MREQQAKNRKDELTGRNCLLTIWRMPQRDHQPQMNDAWGVCSRLSFDELCRI